MAGAHDALLAELSSVARYLGLSKSAQRSIAEQLSALATLREFAGALCRCAVDRGHDGKARGSVLKNRLINALF